MITNKNIQNVILDTILYKKVKVLENPSFLNLVFRKGFGVARKTLVKDIKNLDIISLDQKNYILYVDIKNLLNRLNTKNYFKLLTNTILIKYFRISNLREMGSGEDLIDFIIKSIDPEQELKPIKLASRMKELYNYKYSEFLTNPFEVEDHSMVLKKIKEAVILKELQKKNNIKTRKVLLKQKVVI